ncbi:MAG: ABC transporter permease [Nitrospirae bacterium RBG_16_64_22]|nr:MAG: ABC transporter permease [Nitrospirae bacterium RBG_16_64_22]
MDPVLEQQVEVPPRGPQKAARGAVSSRSSVKRRILVDRIARRLVTLGGVVIIASILAILIVIGIEVYPLAGQPAVTSGATSTAAGGGTPLAIGVDEYVETAFIADGGGITLISFKSGSVLPSPSLAGLGSARIVSASPAGRGVFALGLSDGRAIPVEVRFNVSYIESGRKVEPEVVAAAPLAVDPSKRPIERLAHIVGPDGAVTAAQLGAREIILLSVKETKALVGEAKREESRKTLSLPSQGEITALAIDARGDNLFAGTSMGEIVSLGLREETEPEVTRLGREQDETAPSITALGFLNGDRTLVVGDAAGGVTSWQVLQDAGGDRRLTRIYKFVSHEGPVIAFAPSRRDKGFLTADGSGAIKLHYATTGKTLLDVPAGGAEDSAAASLAALSFAPKADGFVTADAAGRLSHFRLDNPHPEVTWQSLFGKIWYEGYEKPEQVWQSTGGTDDFEAKLSLTPLIYGTLKGTFYALLFAVPLALLGALYTSQFMHPAIKGTVKPVVEIMAALPSVVLGFIAGLWLAPMMEKVVPGLFLIPVVVPVLVLLSLALWRLLPTPARTWVRPGYEVVLLVPVVTLGIWISLGLGGLLEAALLSGDYRGWLLRALGLTYDQRNSLVVGFAMGFAVIPIIFTIAEDSLSNVPQHLVAGSLALGATRWQTAVRIVLPTASPGIFSAVMIGFGRAVGETMIVLMATGNTPIMDWSIFNGFRALSANIAVELPEAPEGGTLFRVLFLAALLLFMMTFVVNTVAELVRLKLRKKYRYL